VDALPELDRVDSIADALAAVMSRVAVDPIAEALAPILTYSSGPPAAPLAHLGRMPFLGSRGVVGLVETLGDGLAGGRGWRCGGGGVEFVGEVVQV
jgi:hypothetical protein